MITATMKNKKNKTGFNLFVKYNLNTFKYSIKHEKLRILILLQSCKEKCCKGAAILKF